MDADEMPLRESFALFKDLASACITVRWCLLMACRLFVEILNSHGATCLPRRFRAIFATSAARLSA